jgi:hypothetical protein
MIDISEEDVRDLVFALWVAQREAALLRVELDRLKAVSNGRPPIEQPVPTAGSEPT